mmetsp:Transcript_102281/g.327955  ORF Transcript_102281/g.327955 Transcript_102281/m.327955 type:complete len:202 (+) Transcript_102281:989-1594(+)
MRQSVPPSPGAAPRPGDNRPRFSQCGPPSNASCPCAQPPGAPNATAAPPTTGPPATSPTGGAADPADAVATRSGSRPATWNRWSGCRARTRRQAAMRHPSLRGPCSPCPPRPRATASASPPRWERGRGRGPGGARPQCRSRVLQTLRCFQQNTCHHAATPAHVHPVLVGPPLRRRASCCRRRKLGASHTDQRWRRNLKSMQ